MSLAHSASSALQFSRFANGPASLQSERKQGVRLSFFDSSALISTFPLQNQKVSGLRSHIRSPHSATPRETRSHSAIRAMASEGSAAHSASNVSPRLMIVSDLDNTMVSIPVFVSDACMQRLDPQIFCACF